MTSSAVWTVDPNDPLPLYYQVYASLLQRIQGGEFQPGTFLPAERQLTEDYGVSRITIIKALNELSREHHIKRQQGRGTVVTHPAERPGTDRGSIAFICNVLDHPYLFQVLMGIARTAAENHRNLQVISSFDTDDVEAQHIKEAIARNVEGIVVFPHHHYQNQALYEELQQQRFPLVMVDRYYPQIETDRIVFNDETAAYQLVRRLLDKGRRRIAVISYFEVEATSVNDLLILSRSVLPVSPSERKRSSSLEWAGEIATFSHKAPAPHSPYQSLAAVHSGEMLGAEAARLLVARTNRSLNDRPKVIMVPMTIVETESDVAEPPKAVADASPV